MWSSTWTTARRKRRSRPSDSSTDRTRSTTSSIAAHHASSGRFVSTRERSDAPRARSGLAYDVARVERVAKAVADEVDRHHREEDEEPGEERDPRRLVHVRGRVVEHVAPRRSGWLDAQTEERERALGDDRRADAERPGDDD